MTDDLDGALRNQARTFTHASTEPTGDIDAVVRRSRTRRRGRVAAATTVAVAIVAIGAFGLREASDRRALVTGPADSPTTAITAPPTSVDQSGTVAAPSTTDPAVTTTVVSAPSSTAVSPTLPPVTSTPATTTVAGPSDPSCIAQNLGLEITYPAGWATDTTFFECSDFDPEPFTLIAGGPQPVAVSVFRAPEGQDLESIIRDMRTETFDTILADERTTLGGYPAYCYQAQGKGLGMLNLGSLIDGCIVDYPQGAIQFTTFARESNEVRNYAPELRWIADHSVALP